MKSVVITMAGESSRFRNAGILTPKYRLPVKGRTLFAWSLLSLQQFLQAEWRVVLVGRSNDENLDEFVAKELAGLGVQGHSLVLLDEPTDGQASTAMLAAPHVDVDDAVIIYNIDTHVDPEHVRVDDFRGDGWVPCFPGLGDGWSFVAADDEGRVSEVREKIRISSHATIGLYGFATFSLFVDAYNRSGRHEGAAEQKERYIAPLYNTLIEDGRAVYKSCLPYDAVVPLGTPDEVQAFSNRK
jgi:dTDP-glucose pyrophosphorylase